MLAAAVSRSPPGRITSRGKFLAGGSHADGPDRSLRDSLTHQLGVLARAVNRTPGRTRLYLLAGGMVLVIVATAAMQVRLNAWNQPFYDAIERRDLPEFLRQLWVFFVIAGILLVLNVAQTGANQLIRVRLRELATTDLIGNWMTRKRAARISRAGEIGVNPDQRIQADAQNLTELTTDLGVGLLQSTVLLASFIGVLWILSQGIVIPIGGRDITIPGYMVWAALIYALSGSLVSWRLGTSAGAARGRPLRPRGGFPLRAGAGVGARRRHRAQQRRGRQPARARSEPRHPRRGAAADRLRAGAADLGDRGLRLGGARLPDRGGGAGVFRRAAELRRADDGGRRLQPGAAVAALVRRQHRRDRRLAGDAAAGDELPPGAARARRRRGGRRASSSGARTRRAASGSMRCGSRPATAAPASTPPLLEVGPGERVLIHGKPSSGRTSFFLAIAGLWSAGSGRISVPPDAEVAYLTQRPFLPSGTLRAALAAGGGAHGDEALRAVLGRVGLDNLAGALDTAARWDRELGLGEQERLSYARLLLERPKWLICDEGLDPVDEASREALLSILADELAESAVVNISQRREPKDFYGRTAELVASRAGSAEGLGSRIECSILPTFTVVCGGWNVAGKWLESGLPLFNRGLIVKGGARGRSFRSTRWSRRDRGRS